MNSKKRLIFIVLPQVLTGILNLLFVTLILLKGNNYFNNTIYNQFWFSLSSSSLLVLYLFILNVKERSKRNFSNGFIIIHYLLTFCIIVLFFKRNIDFGLLAYLIFLQLLLSRLSYRLLYCGFPIASYVLNFLTIVLILNKRSIVWIPVTYYLIQLFENVFGIHYPKLELYLGKYFRGSLILAFFYFYAIVTKPQFNPAILVFLAMFFIFVSVEYLNFRDRKE